jgi:D-hydroxyproline dehydrogenase
MSEQDAVAVVGAGIVGCATALALAREGRAVVLFDRHAPGEGGASFGNAGHLATEHVEPLPSLAFLFGFWRELFALGGPLDLPPHRLLRFAPWARRFARAAFERGTHTRQLAPLVRGAAADWERWLAAIGRPGLLKRHGHYGVWLGVRAVCAVVAGAAHMRELGVPTAPLQPALLGAIAAAAGRGSAGAGLFFPGSAHVLDPLAVCRALAEAAVERGCLVRRAEVRALQSAGAAIEAVTAEGARRFAAAVVCAGPWSASLLQPFGIRAPLEAARGYHVELPGHAAHADAPLVYMDRRIVVTPLAGRLRATGYMEFEEPEAPPDPRKPARLLEDLERLGYRCRDATPAWVGSRPVLPDFLPGIGRAPPPCPLYYAVGHQLLGLTLAPVTAEAIAALLAGRTSEHDLRAFDLARFGRAAERPP